MLYVAILTQIGHESLIENQLPTFVYLWAETWSHEKARSQMPWLGRAWKWSIGQWHPS
jgi:hypothetical protein